MRRDRGEYRDGPSHGRSPASAAPAAIARGDASGIFRMLLCLLLCAALAACSRLSFIKPDLGRGEFNRTAPELDIDTDPRNKNHTRAMVAVRRGQQLLREGQLDSAGKAAREAVRLDEASAAAHTLMALVADRRGDADTAGDHYRRAVDLAPARGGMLNNYGTWLCQNGRAAESLDWFVRAFRAPGYDTPAVAAANAGSCALLAGEPDRAGRYLQVALDLEPTNPVALLAMARHEYDAGRAFHARAFAERRLAAAPATADALRLASQIEKKLGDNEAAARYVQRLRAEFPDSSGSGTGEDG